MLNLRDMMPQGGRKTKRRKLTVPEALDALTDEEAGKLIDIDRLQKDAIRRAEQAGIIFIDEIDKVAGREGGSGPDVSREGVQRDLLPIVEGSTVSTKYGPLKTDHVLFIAAGAFHVAKPKDMIPELQGRFPIRVELESLSDDDFVRILTEPENALTKQYTALLATENITLDIRPDAVDEIARVATLVNSRMENIGARRLHTIMERVLDDLAFEAPSLGTIDRAHHGRLRPRAPRRHPQGRGPVAVRALGARGSRGLSRGAAAAWPRSCDDRLTAGEARLASALARSRGAGAARAERFVRRRQPGESEDDERRLRPALGGEAPEGRGRRARLRVVRHQGADAAPFRRRSPRKRARRGSPRSTSTRAAAGTRS